MNKTKKLTQGAMLLAIIGALMLIDRQLSFFFSDIIIMMIPVVIAIYTTMYSIKDGAILSFGLIVLSVLFGSLTSYIYFPIGIVVGLGFSMGIKANFDRRKITFIAMALYILGEVIATFVVTPLLGVDVASQINELSNVIEEYGLSESLNALSFNTTSFFLVIYVASIVIIGALEGYITSLLSVLLLKRLKIKNIGFNSVLDLKISPALTYVLFGLSVLMFVNINLIREINEIASYIVICISFMSSLVLAYYGYIYLVIYSKLKGGKVGTILIIVGIILLFPTSYLVLMIIGFLYGSGPLRVKIENMVKERSNNIQL